MHIEYPSEEVRRFALRFPTANDAWVATLRQNDLPAQAWSSKVLHLARIERGDLCDVKWLAAYEAEQGIVGGIWAKAYADLLELQARWIAERDAGRLLEAA